MSIADRFTVVLSNRYQVLYWKETKEAMNYSCKEVVGRRMPGQKEWISVEPLEDTGKES